MKKTIAILLVLVIAGVGLFAADPASKELHLTTTINVINEMIITKADATEVTWTAYSQTEDINASSTASDSSNAVEIDPFSTEAQAVGKLWTRSNNRLGYTVKIAATTLINSTEDEFINYTITGGDNEYTTLSDSVPAAVDYSTQAAVAGLQELSPKTISVTLDSAATTQSTGTYTGNITFNFVSNS